MKKFTFREQIYKRVKIQKGWEGYKITIYACVARSFESEREWSYRPTQTDLSDHIILYFIYIGNRRKGSEISGICLSLVTHLNHKLTRATYELRVWLTRERSAKNLFEPPTSLTRNSCSSVVVGMIPAWNSEMSVSVGASPVAKQPYIISHRGYTQHWRSINARRGKASCVNGVLTQSVIISWIAVFNSVSKVISELLWFCIALLGDWFKVLAPLFQPIVARACNFSRALRRLREWKELDYPGLTLSSVSRSPWLGACIFGTAFSHTKLFWDWFSRETRPLRWLLRVFANTLTTEHKLQKKT